MLIRKMLRDIKNNISQYITIFLMVFIGVMAYTGIEAYMEGMRKSANDYYEEYNLQEIDAFGAFTDDDIKEVLKIEHVNNVNGKLTLSSNANIEEFKDHTVRLIFIENNTVSKFYVDDGISFDSTKNGVWVDLYYANENGIKVGDTLTFTYEGITLKEKVLGLVTVPDMVYSVKDDTEIFPNHSDYGFMYLSINEIPEKLIKDMVMNESGIEDEAKFDMMYKYANGKDFNYKDYIMYTSLMIDIDSEDNLDYVRKELDKIDNLSASISIKDELSYSGYQSEIEEGETYVGIFSGLFLFIAILSVVTTMTRVVKKERTEIGTLKALGYSNFRVSMHYISYGLLIAFLASILGIVVGYIGLGKFWVSLEMRYYEVPNYKAYMVPSDYIVAACVVLAVVVTTYLSTRRVLKLNAADTLRPERPSGAGKNLNITRKGIFKHLGFSSKWNFRDILRNKMRTITALVGIIGCMMLLVCALGMYDSIQNYLKIQFSDISNYKYRLNLSETISDDELNNLISRYGDNTSETLMIEIEKDGKITSNNVFIDNSHGYVRFMENYNKFMKLSDNGVYITSKFAKLNGYDIGDEIKFHIYGDTKYYTFKIVGFNKDPQNQNISMTKKFYEDNIGKYSPQFLYTNDDLSNVEELNGVSSIQSIDNIKSGVDSMLSTMISMILLIIVIASLLGAIIIYNMGILSFTEKNYQFATLKVLGFDDKKISRIFNQQNLWICIVAIIIGLPLGFYMTDFIFKDAIGDSYDFEAHITALTYVISALGTYIVTYLVSKFLARKIKKIDMVTSLKSNE